MREVSIADTNLTEAEVDAAVAVLRSGALRQGAKCTEFEAAFAAWVGADHAMTCANGSASLQLAYLALLEPGDEVLVPSFTFIATASMVNAAGGVPVFCDVDPDTHMLDLADAEARITDRTRAIAPVHLFGNAVDVDGVVALAQKHDLKIVWDAAQAHGTLWNGVDVGAATGVVSWSFYPTKTMFVGEGGMVCTDDADLDAQLRLLRSHGVSGRYNHVRIGLNCRMTDVEAAIGLEQLKIVDERVDRRRRNGAMLTEAFSAMEALTPQVTTEGATHSFHQYCATFDAAAAGMSREDFMAKLGEKGISTGIHYPRGLHQQPVYLDMYGPKSFPVTEALAASIMAFPVHHALDDSDISYVIDSVTDVLA